MSVRAENDVPWDSEVTLIKAIMFGDTHLCVRERKTELDRL